MRHSRRPHAGVEKRAVATSYESFTRVKMFTLGMLPRNANGKILRNERKRLFVEHAH